jgi:hypothetical protein
MLKGILAFVLTRRTIVLMGLLVFVGAGYFAFKKLDIEAYPNPAPVILEITAHALAPAFHAKPLPPGAAIHDAVISGTGFKHSLSTLASVGGAATGKSTAVINGTSVVRPKPQL